MLQKRTQLQCSFKSRITRIIYVWLVMKAYWKEREESYFFFSDNFMVRISLLRHILQGNNLKKSFLSLTTVLMISVSLLIQGSINENDKLNLCQNLFKGIPYGETIDWNIKIFTNFWEISPFHKNVLQIFPNWYVL